MWRITPAAHVRLRLIGRGSAFSQQAVLLNVRLAVGQPLPRGAVRDTDLPRLPGTGVHVKRRRCLMTIMVAISVAMLAACSDGSTGSQPPPAESNTPVPTPATASSAPTTTTTTPAGTGELRLGCGTACQSAGGYGGANPLAKTWVEITKVVGGCG
jgi:hypothetical protein